MRTFKNTTMREQLSAAIIASVLIAAILSAFVSSWIGTQQTRKTLVHQGNRVAENFASRCVLALLFESAENAEEAMQTTLTFPDVTRVEIRMPDGRALVIKGKGDTATKSGVDMSPPNWASEGDKEGPEAYMEKETDDTWWFVAPVMIVHTNNPVEVDTPRRQVLGYVRIIQSKATISDMVINLWSANISISIVLTILALLIIRRFSARITYPLRRLSTAMNNAVHGEAVDITEVSGPSDIREMTLAFNHMSSALKEREAEREALLTQLRQLLVHLEAVREEQNRIISRELHDAIGGNLTMLKLGLASMLEEGDVSNDICVRLASLLAISHSTIQISKNITIALRPTMLDTMGFLPTIRWYTEEFAQTTRIPCDLQCEADFSLSPERSTAMFRIVQEALTNVARHAEATRVTITIAMVDKCLVLNIDDNGKGFSTHNSDSTGSFGLLGMRERVNYLNGQIDISTKPKEGVRIKISVPLEVV